MKYYFFSFLMSLFSTSFVLAEDVQEFEIDDGIKLIVDACHRTKDNTVLLKYRIKNESNQIFDLNTLGHYGPTEVDFLDLNSRKKYGCITHRGSECFAAHWGNQSSKIAPNSESKKLWAQFTAPPVETKEVSLAVADLLPADGLKIGEIPSK